MAEPRKPIGELRKELQKMMIDLSVRPSQVKKREDLVQMIDMYGKFAEQKKSTPLPERSKGGRPKAKEVESGADEMGISIPKKISKEKTEYAVEKEKKAKKNPIPKPSIAESSGTESESEEEETRERVAKKSQKVVEKPKRVISPEHLAKMKAGREARKAAAASPDEDKKKAEPKKETPPPDAPHVRDLFNKLPVRKLA